MKLSDLGERKIVDKILSIIGDNHLGDDSAYIDVDDSYLLVSSDIIRKETHLPNVMTPYDIGWFVTSINLSDIAAMGGEVIGVLLSLSLPSDLDEDFVLSLIKGAKDCVGKYGGRILGGDTKEHNEITVSGTAIGRVSKEEILFRKGAKPEDIVAVTGHLGKAGAGYLAIKNKLDGVELRGLIRPEPRIREGRELAKSRCISSCMDISDGLSSSLYQLAKINDVGFTIEREKIPVSEEAFKVGEILNIDPYSIAIDFGGDYELLVTLSKDKFDEIKKKVKIYEMGKVTKEKEISIICHGKKRKLQDRGWEHFRQRL